MFPFSFLFIIFHSMMNPADLFAINKARTKFAQNHPKVSMFIQYMLSKPMSEGTVIRMEITRPGENPVATSMQVTPDDLEMMELIKKLSKKK